MHHRTFDHRFRHHQRQVVHTYSRVHPGVATHCNQEGQVGSNQTSIASQAFTQCQSSSTRPSICLLQFSMASAFQTAPLLSGTKCKHCSWTSSWNGLACRSTSQMRQLWKTRFSCLVVSKGWGDRLTSPVDPDSAEQVLQEQKVKTLSFLCFVAALLLSFFLLACFAMLLLLSSWVTTVGLRSWNLDRTRLLL